MVKLFEVKISEKKPIFLGLSSIYGIGKKHSFILCKKLGFSKNLKIKDLDKEQLAELVSKIESLDLKLGKDLKKFKSLTLKRLVSIKSYRGLRRKRGLPIRGQRTHTNAKTARKKY